jgi:hypothetical protein
MKKYYFGLLLLVLAVFTTEAEAITVSVDPATQTIGAGSSTQVALTISGLGIGAAPSLSTYDLNVAYDPSIITLTGVTFGDPVLGDQLDLFSLGSLTSSSDSPLGTINVFELSFDNPSDIDALQANAFTLATLSFNTLASGTSSLALTINVLGDANGDPLTASTISSSITVSAVPVPAAVWLFGSGLLGLIGVARRKAA